MREEKEYFPEVTDEMVENVMKSVKRYYQELTISKVNGECPYGHKEGELFNVTATSHDGLCGSLYHAIHAPVTSQHYGGAGYPWEKDPLVFKGYCPEMGKVQVDARRVEKEESNPRMTQPVFKDMTGKGFASLDTYRVFVEILGVENHCMWGHAEGQRHEVDPFNIGGVCGFLYWEAYHFIIHLFAGGSLPWEPDENVVHGVCPDVYNQTTFRLVRGKR